MKKIYGYINGQGTHKITVKLIFVTPQKTELFVSKWVRIEEFLSVEDAPFALHWREGGGGKI